MIVNTITELTVVGVFDRGQPNQERIVLQANEIVNMGQYGLMLGVRAADGSAFPMRDNLFWFGDGYVSENDWIFIYTGPGEPRTTELPNLTQRLYSIHWGRDLTILHHEDFVPILFRVDSVQVPISIKSLPKPTG